MATKFFMNGGVNSNWSTDGNWSTTASSGPANTTKAVNGDVATFDSGSPNCTVDTASACTTLTCTGYTHTLTFNGTLTVAGAVTLASGMTIAGTSDLICTTTATLTSGGKTLTGGLQLQGTSQTFTLSGAWIVNGTLNFNGTTGTVLNSSTISCGGLTVGIAVTGSSAITVTGGTWSGAGSHVQNTTFAGNVTVSGIVTYKTGTLTYSSGTITTTSSTLTLSGNTTLATSGVTWNNVTISGTGLTITINSTLTASGTFTLPNGATTFAGTAGFSVATLMVSALTVSRIYTFKATNTYAVTSSVVVLGTTSTIRAAFTGSDGTHATKAIFTVSSGADMSLPYVDPTDIDSSGGIPVYTYKGTIATSTNWVAGALTLPTAGNVKSGSGTFGYSDALITPTYAAGGGGAVLGSSIVRPLH